MFEVVQIGEDMQPQYDNIRKRIDDLPVNAELKTDLIESVEVCQQFSVIWCSTVWTICLKTLILILFKNRPVCLQRRLAISRF